MHLKPVCAPKDRQQVHDLIENVVLGALVAAGPDGLTAAHLPFMIDRDRGEHGTLVCHLAAANPHAQLVRAGTEMMAIFMSPNAYVSSSWFVDRNAAPTRACAAVHCHGRPRVQEGHEAVRTIGRLVNTLEAGRPDRWRLAEIGADGPAARMPRIVCFGMPIERIEARFQLGQEERAADMAAAATVLAERGDTDVATLVREYDADRT